MSLTPILIAPFQTGLDTDLTPWIAPPDSFSIADNVHIRHGIIEKRAGLRAFGTLSNGLRVMGIGRYIQADGTKLTLAWDTENAYRYNTVTFAFDILDSPNQILSGGDEDFIWFVNWQASGGLNRLYFTNGLEWNGSGGAASRNGIRYYDNTAATTTLFTPSLNTAGTRTLYGAKLVFSLRQRLLVLNTFENDTVSTENFPQRLRWCKAQNPGDWDDTVAGGGGFVDAPTGEQIVSAQQIQDQIIVFFTDSVWAIEPVSNPALPFRWVKINSYRACDGKMASVGYDRYVGSLGVRGITASDTNQTTRMDDRIEDFVVDSINVDAFGKVFCERDFQNKRWWTLFPNVESEENDAALIYDDDSKAFTTYSISLNCLGYGNQAMDFGLDDFVGPDFDFALEDMGEETLLDFYWQDNQEIFLGGDTSGNVFVLEVDADDDGSSISSELISAAWNPYQKDGDESQMSYIDFFVDSQTDTVALIEFFKDSAISPYDSQIIDFLPDLGFIASVQDITQANPANVNAASHGLSTGDEIYIYNAQGMDTINGIQYTITVVDEDNFTLDDIDSSLFDAYTGGAQVVRREFYRDRIWKRAYAGGIGNEHRIRITSSGVDTPFRFHAFKPYFKKRGRRTID